MLMRAAKTAIDHLRQFARIAANMINIVARNDPLLAGTCCGSRDHQVWRAAVQVNI